MITIEKTKELSKDDLRLLVNQSLKTILLQNKILIELEQIDSEKRFEMTDWCKINIKGYWFLDTKFINDDFSQFGIGNIDNIHIMYFELEEDLIAFKIMWEE